MIGTYKTYYEKYMMIINGLDIFAVWTLFQRNPFLAADT